MKWIVLIMFIPFSGPASAQDSPRYRSYMACLADKVAGVDDGISDAATVAGSLRSACRTEFNATINDLSKSMTIGELRTLDARAAEIQTEYTTRAVLMARVAQRKPQTATQVDEQSDGKFE